MVKRLKIFHFFFLAGIICFLVVIFLVWQKYKPRKVEFELSEGKDFQPIAAIIKELNIELPIYPATFENGRWQATAKGVSYLTGSAAPGEKGNSILYAHNWPNLFGNLIKIQPSQVIEIKAANGEIKSFTVVETKILNPKQTYILGSSSEARLTIYTCTGFLDQNRFVVTAVPL